MQLATMHIVNFHVTRTPQERGGPDNGCKDMQSNKKVRARHPQAATRSLHLSASDPEGHYQIGRKWFLKQTLS